MPTAIEPTSSLLWEASCLRRFKTYGNLNYATRVKRETIAVIMRFSTPVLECGQPMTTNGVLRSGHGYQARILIHAGRVEDRFWVAAAR